MSGTITEDNIATNTSRNKDIENSRKIVNVVTTADLRQPVQIQKFNKFPWGRFDLQNNYNGKVGYVKDDNMQGRVTVFTSGKMISTGAKSVRHSIKQLNRTMILLFQNQFIEKTKLRPQVRNIVGTGDNKKSIDLHLMAKIVSKSIYEPEQFPGLILKTDNGPTCLIFASGKVVVAGARSEIELDSIQTWLEEKLEEFGII